MAESKAYEGSNSATERVASHPYLGIGIQSCNVVVEVLGSIVVPVLRPQSRDETGRVAFVGRGLTVANLSPEELSALSAAAAEEEIVVDLVVGSRLRTIEDSRRCSFQAYDNGGVLRVGKDVSAQAVRLPAKVFGVVVSVPHVFPFSSMRFEYVRVRCHTSKAYDGLFVGYVGSRDLVDGPVLGSQLHGFPAHAPKL